MGNDLLSGFNRTQDVRVETQAIPQGCSLKWCLWLMAQTSALREAASRADQLLCDAGIVGCMARIIYNNQF